METSLGEENDIPDGLRPPTPEQLDDQLWIDLVCTWCFSIDQSQCGIEDKKCPLVRPS